MTNEHPGGSGKWRFVLIYEKGCGMISVSKNWGESMKKVIALGLVLILCFACVGCGGTAGDHAQSPEQIGINTLLADLDNQAKAEMNIGKATTMFVKIETIFSDHCVVYHLMRGGSSDVYMETEQLAQLEKGEFAALYGVVQSVATNEGGTSFRYVFKDGRPEDMALFDAYVAQMNYGSSSGDNDYIFDREDFLKSYASTRWEALSLDGEEIKTFLLGTWERRIDQYFSSYNDSFTGTHTPEITFYADGTYVTQCYNNDTSRSDFIFGEYKQADGTWVIEQNSLKLDGYIDSSLDLAHSVYKISENVFIWDGEIFIRCA